MKSIEEYFSMIDPDRRKYVEIFHRHMLSEINNAKGSRHNHQFWVGGYRDHIEQCLFIAEHLYKIDVGSMNFDSIFMVLYFHDIEKAFNYTLCDKDYFLNEILPNSS